MLNKYLYEKPFIVLLIVSFFVSTLLSAVVYCIFSNRLENSGLVFVTVMAFIAILAFVVNISDGVIRAVQQNPKRMIAYANSNNAYSMIMNESIKQSDTPKNALSSFKAIFYDQHIKAICAKDAVAIAKAIQEFQKMKRELR